MLHSKKVTDIFMDCLFKDGEDTTNHIEAEGVISKVGFHPERLVSHKTEIKEMLGELPTEFQKTNGGGWSFLNAGMDKNGHQWTGEHIVVEQLLLLGIAGKMAKILLPRELWPALPGGMPYFMVDTSGGEE